MVLPVFHAVADCDLSSGVSACGQARVNLKYLLTYIMRLSAAFKFTLSKDTKIHS